MSLFIQTTGMRPVVYERVFTHHRFIINRGQVLFKKIYWKLNVLVYTCPKFKIALENFPQIEFPPSITQIAPSRRPFLLCRRRRPLRRSRRNREVRRRQRWRRAAGNGGGDQRVVADGFRHLRLHSGGGAVTPAVHVVYRGWVPRLDGAFAPALGVALCCIVVTGALVLYLGAAFGIPVSHVSDLVGPEGVIYAVESHRSGRDLVNMAKKITNVIPIIEVARIVAQ